LVISPSDQQRIFDASEGPFRAILTALRETGARPNEICSALVEHYRDGTIVLSEHKEDETGEDRVIYLTESAKVLVEGLIGARHSGPIFRNSRGEPWTPDTVYCRFKRLRARLGITDGAYPYSFRHRFASDAINGTATRKGLDSLVVAKLIGHGDARMLQKHYYRGEVESLRRAAEQAKD
jgi:integrase